VGKNLRHGRRPDAQEERGAVMIRQRVSQWLWAPRTITVTAENLTWFLLAVGLVLRVGEYHSNRPLYMDEVDLVDNIAGWPIFDLHTRLVRNQLAPPGFLVVERAVAHTLGASRSALRFFPLATALAALFLFRDVARRFIDRRAVPIAMGLFAVSDYLLYYASEIKPYSCDLAVALASLSVAARLERERITAARAAVLGMLGAAATWFSFAAPFVLAGAGSYLVGVALARKDWPSALAVATAGLLWAVGFAGCYVVAQRLLSTDQFIWNWWHFAFLPVPPRSIAEAERVFWHLANLFVNPASLHTPLGPLGSALLGLGLSLAGSVALARTRIGHLYLLVAPAALVLAASSLHKYPFHGRLVMFLVPSILLLVAHGVTAVGNWTARPVIYPMLGVLFFYPAIEALDHQDRPRVRGYSPHGDLRPDLLQYLESRASRIPGVGR
jgi:hypothetical protein